MFELTGTIIRIFPTNQVSETKRYRTFWVRTDDFEPQFIRLQLSQISCDLLDNLKYDDHVIVNFNISGKPREKNGILELYNNNNVTGLNKIE